MRLTARMARPSDGRLIGRLCRRAAGPRDYVLSILRETIDDGGLFLAWRDSELVGMTNFEKCVDGTGWLSMARTDPIWRRSGVALFLQRQIASYAKRRGITTLRLWTSSKNKPSLSAIRKGGFRQVCEAAHISYHFKTKVKNRVIHPCSRVPEDQLESLLSSDYLSQMSGYLAYKWHFVKANKRLLRLVLRRGELYAVGSSAFILTKPERIFGEFETSLTLLTGKVTGSLTHSKEAAEALGARVIGAYIPYDRYKLRTAMKLGFKREHWGRHCLIFERNTPLTNNGYVSKPKPSRIH